MIDVFVISPYSDEDPDVVTRRVIHAEEYIAHLVRQRVVAYSTIAAMAHIVRDCDLPGDWHYWRAHCTKMIECSAAVQVLMLPGWASSTGVRDEIKIAKEMDKQIEFIPWLEPDTSHIPYFEEVK